MADWFDRAYSGRGVRVRSTVTGREGTVTRAWYADGIRCVRVMVTVYGEASELDSTAELWIEVPAPAWRRRAGHAADLTGTVRA